MKKKLLKIAGLALGGFGVISLPIITTSCSSIDYHPAKRKDAINLTINGTDVVTGNTEDAGFENFVAIDKDTKLATNVNWSISSNDQQVNNHCGISNGILYWDDEIAAGSYNLTLQATTTDANKKGSATKKVNLFIAQHKYTDVYDKFGLAFYIFDGSKDYEEAGNGNVPLATLYSFKSQNAYSINPKSLGTIAENNNERWLYLGLAVVNNTTLEPVTIEEIRSQVKSKVSGNEANTPNLMPITPRSLYFDNQEINLVGGLKVILTEEANYGGGTTLNSRFILPYIGPSYITISSDLEVQFNA